MNDDTHEKIRASLAASVLRLGNECRDLAAENARLKAEVERLKNNCAYLDKKLDEELNQ